MYLPQSLGTNNKSFSFLLLLLTLLSIRSGIHRSFTGYSVVNRPFAAGGHVTKFFLENFYIMSYSFKNARMERAHRKYQIGQV